MWGAALQYNVWGQEDEAGQIWADYYGDAMRTIKKAYKPQSRGGLYRHSSRNYSSFYTVYGDSMLFGKAHV
jgi:methionine salvage enolase-phosphatase E1